MSNWPRGLDRAHHETIGADTATSLQTSVVSGATAETKGSWTQIAAATSFSYDGFWLNRRFVGTGSRRVVVDIGIGGSGAEQAIVSDFSMFVQTSATADEILHIPVHVPAGSRVTMRTASDGTSIATRFSILGMTAGWNQPYSFCRAQNVGLTGTQGTIVDAGGVANTKGSWVSIGGATTEQYDALMLCVNVSTYPTAQTAAADFLIDVAIGAGFDSILENLHFSQSTNVNGGSPVHWGPFDIRMPAGTQVSARCQCTSAVATVRAIQLSYLGFVS